MAKDIKIATEIKDSGDRTAFSTGSVRDKRVGKGRMDLLPAVAIIRLAKHFETGALKYGSRNWEKGQPLSTYLDSALRHAFKYVLGMRDEDHCIAACWNLMCLAHTETLIAAGQLPATLNDLPESLDPSVTEALLALLEPHSLKFSPNKEANMDIPVTGNEPPFVVPTIQPPICKK